ncbi:unnamed protein product [Phytophthora fragariaefolia]|uniref:Unnamed protein product n=1 Tax=Phytophthora fragariaefolia TaxID=1490495 RepID=A0A9W6WV78_9STRA|nr:unnamed protein product [Phytophthora fragariaefolia]
MAKRVLRYLQGTCDYGFLWKKPASPDLHFTAYADADLGSEMDDRRSITGFVLQMNGCTYAYKSDKQSIAHADTCSQGVDLKYHKVRDLYERGDFAVRYCPTTDMLADIFTKPLGSTQVLQTARAPPCGASSFDRQQCQVTSALEVGVSELAEVDRAPLFDNQVADLALV